MTLANIQPGSLEEHLLKGYRERKAENDRLSRSFEPGPQLIAAISEIKTDPLLVALEWLDTVEMPKRFPGEWRTRVDHYGEIHIVFREPELDLNMDVTIHPRIDDLQYVKLATSAAVYQWLSIALLDPAVPEALR